MWSNKSFIQYKETCFVQITKLSADHTDLILPTFSSALQVQQQ